MPGAQPQGCFPLTILCRSAIEAKEVWKLQTMVKLVETRARKVAAAAFIMNVVVCNMFTHDDTAKFYVAFLNLWNRPVIYFSW